MWFGFCLVSPWLFIFWCIYWLQNAWAARIVELLRRRMQSEYYLEKLAEQLSLTHISYYTVWLWYIIFAPQGHLTLSRTCGPLIAQGEWWPFQGRGLAPENDSPKVQVANSEYWYPLWSLLFPVIGVWSCLEYAVDTFTKSFFLWSGKCGWRESPKEITFTTT